MKTNTIIIIWIAQRFYQNKEIADLLVAHNVCPLLDSSYAVGIWERLGKPETMRNWTFGEWTKQLPYKDELISAYGMDVDEVKNELIELPNLICGETSTETIQQLVDAGCKSITYTSYGWHLFRIFGLNIRMPFSTQLNTWKKLEKLYNVRKDLPPYQLHNETFKETVKRVWHENKFNFCWIMLDQTKHFEKLISWCKDHDKVIGLVCPDSWNKEMPVEEMYNKLKTFINILEK